MKEPKRQDVKESSSSHLPIHPPLPMPRHTPPETENQTQSSIAGGITAARQTFSGDTHPFCGPSFPTNTTKEQWNPPPPPLVFPRS